MNEWLNGSYKKCVLYRNYSKIRSFTLKCVNRNKPVCLVIDDISTAIVESSTPKADPIEDKVAQNLNEVFSIEKIRWKLMQFYSYKICFH